MVIGLPKIDHPTQICEGCLVAKQARSPFSAQAQFRETCLLELVHVDLCGPITPQTNVGNKYFMLFVDDYSRAMWVYMLKKKGDAKVAFQKFLA